MGSRNDFVKGHEPTRHAGHRAGIQSDNIKRVSMESAIRREKAIKKWKRTWKLALIEKSNPEWLDLYDQLF